MSAATRFASELPIVESKCSAPKVVLMHIGKGRFDLSLRVSRNQAAMLLAPGPLVLKGAMLYGYSDLSTNLGSHLLRE